jgi:hypothetical protein
LAVVAVVEEKGEGRGFWQGSLGFLLFSSSPTGYDKGESWTRFLLGCNEKARQIYPLVGLFEKRERKERKGRGWGARVVSAKIQIQI